MLFLDEIGDVPRVDAGAAAARLAGRRGAPGRFDGRAAVSTFAWSPRRTSISRRRWTRGGFGATSISGLSTFQLALPRCANAAKTSCCWRAALLAARGAAERCRRQADLRRGLDGASWPYAWPGNVRELGNVMEYAVTLCDGSSSSRSTFHRICSRRARQRSCRGRRDSSIAPRATASSAAICRRCCGRAAATSPRRLAAPGSIAATCVE